MIQDIYNTYVNCAKTIPGFIVGQKEDVPYDITDLANAYCAAVDAHDDIKRDQYISALMIRYWHVVVLTYQESKSSRLDIDDITSWLYEAFEKALSRRSWLDTTKSIYKDPKGAEKAINRCIYTVRNDWYRVFNRARNKINYLTYSLDALLNLGITEQLSSGDEQPLSVGMNIAGDDIVNDTSRDLVQKYIDKNMLVTAIILDSIMFQDSFVYKNKTTDTGEVDEEGEPVEIVCTDVKFSHAKLVKTLRGLNDAYATYFKDVYTVDEHLLKTTIETLTQINKRELYKYIDTAFDTVKNSEEDLNWICS